MRRWHGSTIIFKILFCVHRIISNKTWLFICMTTARSFELCPRNVYILIDYEEHLLFAFLYFFCGYPLTKIIQKKQDYKSFKTYILLSNSVLVNSKYLWLLCKVVYPADRVEYPSNMLLELYIDSYILHSTVEFRKNEKLYF